MSRVYNKLEEMLEMVASALGDDLLRDVAFVGGCTTGLLLTDDFSKEDVRYTDDVDLIVSVIGYAEWAKLQENLRSKGFMESVQDDVNCRMRLGELKVDFMPDDEAILGYSNRWYSDGLSLAEDYKLTGSLTIRLLTAPYFVATKLEAYHGRGNDDPILSHDLEDILSLFDGREELVKEITNSKKDLRQYIAEQMAALLLHKDFEYAVQGFTRGDKDRIQLIFERLEAVKSLVDVN